MKKNSDKNIKLNNGVTIVALVITIIVLIILAGVSIVTLLGENGILKQTNDAVVKTEIEQVKEEVRLWDMKNLIYYEKNIGFKPMSEEEFVQYLKDKELISKDTVYENEQIIVHDEEIKISSKNSEEEIPTVKPDEIQKEDVIYTDEKNVAIIPKGFKISSLKEEQSIENGLVIKDKEDNEFVWIPVGNVNDMYGTLENGSKSGKLYSTYEKDNLTPLNWTLEENGNMKLISTMGYREPAKLTYYPYSYPTTLLTEYQKEFEDMLNSIKKNKGFYISRYEMNKGEDGSTSTAKSIKNSLVYTSFDGHGWGGLYLQAKTYQNEDNSTIKSQMIWGSQYDQMLIWMTNCGINVQDTSLAQNGKNISATITGCCETDKINNIYDLLGRGVEWTQAANSTAYREKRGGYNGGNLSLANRDQDVVNKAESNRSTRFCLVF